jgi:quinol-cytochrome oxidoreductase complex cytochrome b subunit
MIGGAGIAMAISGVAAWFTGSFLAWDQLALWSVTAGTNFTGARAVFRDEVKFVLVGTQEISPGSYATILAIHAALAVVLVLLLGLAWTAAFRRDVPRG